MNLFLTVLRSPLVFPSAVCATGILHFRLHQLVQLVQVDLDLEVFAVVHTGAEQTHAVARMQRLRAVNRIHQQVDIGFDNAGRQRIREGIVIQQPDIFIGGILVGAGSDISVRSVVIRRLGGDPAVFILISRIPALDPGVFGSVPTIYVGIGIKIL